MLTKIDRALRKPHCILLLQIAREGAQHSDCHSGTLLFRAIRRRRRHCTPRRRRRLCLPIAIHLGGRGHSANTVNLTVGRGRRHGRRETGAFGFRAVIQQELANMFGTYMQHKHKPAVLAGGNRVRAPLWRSPCTEIVRLAQFELERANGTVECL